MKSLKSISDEWFNAYCWRSVLFGISIMKKWIEFSLLIKALESSKCFKSVFCRLLIKYWYFALYWSFAYRYILSISCWFFIKFNGAFVFFDPEPPIINNLYGLSGIYF